jgi:hypothetical protein
MNSIEPHKYKWIRKLPIDKRIKAMKRLGITERDVYGTDTDESEDDR